MFMSDVVPLLTKAITSRTTTRSESPFEAMVREHWDAVYRLLQSMTGSIHDTEDLAQETFLRAWKRIGTFQPGTRMRSWLLKIAANAFLDEQRRRKRARVHVLDADVQGPVVAAGHAIDMREQAALVREAMNDLSELTRLVFHLRATEDLSFREIAEVAGTTEQSARWHMHHARTWILQRMGGGK